LNSLIQWPRILRGEILFHVRSTDMPRGDKSKYTEKQKRQAEHIAEGYEDRGVSKKEAKSRAWATVNKSTGGGKKSGSGRGKAVNKGPAKKGGRKGGAASAARSAAARSVSAKKAARTRARNAAKKK
jgi:plasmid stabilization system protein ParE